MEDYNLSIEKRRYSIIHNPIDTDLFEYKEKDVEQRLNIISIRPYASAVYANDLTARAIIELSKRNIFPYLHFSIYGDGPLFEETTKPLRDFPNVSISKGFLPRSKIAQLHKTHGILLIPTRMDSQGVSRDEAMSSGLVPITNRVAAVPEFADETCAYLVESENYVAMADAIEDLYNNPEKFLRMSRSAAMRVRRQTCKKIVIMKEIAVIHSQLQHAPMTPPIEP